jgi:hypothetical protein
MRDYIDLHRKAEQNFQKIKTEEYDRQIEIIEENLKSPKAENPDFVYMVECIRCKIIAQHKKKEAAT